MNRLTAATTFELKDQRSVYIANKYRDIEIFRNIHGAVSESWLVDRTEHIQLPFKSKLLDENKIPKIDKKFNLDLDQICLSRSVELASQNDHIYIMWSGGIDSTLIIVSFLMAKINCEQITVACNQESIKENPEFYKNFILGKFKIMSSELLMQQMKLGVVDGLIISGEQGDLIFGQDFGSSMFSKYGKNYLKLSPSRNTIVKFFTDSDMTESAANCWYDIFMGSAHLSPRPIDTVYDFSWWAGFNWRWQWALEKVKMRSLHDQRIKTFFSSYNFQQWSIAHNQSISETTDFKLPYKRIICDYTKDFRYLQKIKIPSATIYYGANSYAALTDDGARHTAKTFSLMDYYQKDNFIVDWLNSQ
jgi:hypothetical protein